MNIYSRRIPPYIKSVRVVSNFAKSIVVVFYLLCSCTAAESQPSETAAEKNTNSGTVNLMRAYPDMIRSISASYIEMYDGTRFNYEARTVPFEAMLNETSLYDQMCQPYPRGKILPPAFNHDPGRFRFQPLFQKMYGGTRQEVEKNLVTIRWMEGYDNTPVRVTRINGVNTHLLRISGKLLTLAPEIRKYARKPAAYNWRPIEGTSRLSPHSYGIAIDIAVDKSHYWLWDKKRGFYRWVDDFPHEIVEIFESEGFIWGGRWYHYDTMHFEYRPELLPAQ